MLIRVQRINKTLFETGKKKKTMTINQSVYKFLVEAENRHEALEAQNGNFKLVADHAVIKQLTS